MALLLIFSSVVILLWIAEASDPEGVLGAGKGVGCAMEESYAELGPLLPLSLLCSEMESSGSRGGVRAVLWAL